MYKYGPKLYYFIVYAQSSSTGTLLNLILLFEVDLIPQLCLNTGVGRLFVVFCTFGEESVST